MGKQGVIQWLRWDKRVLPRGDSTGVQSKVNNGSVWRGEDWRRSRRPKGG